MSVAKVFRSGNSQAVRLPKAFRLETSELAIFRRGDEIDRRVKALRRRRRRHRGLH
jgi:antitoxin VapB